jgi:hypothetical protein
MLVSICNPSTIVCCLCVAGLRYQRPEAPTNKAETAEKIGLLFFFGRLVIFFAGAAVYLYHENQPRKGLVSPCLFRV